MEEQTIVYSVKDLIQFLHNNNFERHDLIFRGQSNSNWKIEPSLFRNMKFGLAEKFELVSFEPLLSGFKSFYTFNYNPVEFLILLQHFEVPTRLLDWSYDPLVALYFACSDILEKKPTENGKFILTKQEFFPKMKTNSIDNEAFNSLNADLFKESFLKLNTIDNIQLVEPILKNPRMRNQEGLLMIFPFYPLTSIDLKYVNFEEYISASNQALIERNKDKPELEQEQDYFIAHLEIDKNSKEKIMYELDYFYGINQNTLFGKSPYLESVIHEFEQIKLNAGKKLDWLLNMKE